MAVTRLATMMQKNIVSRYDLCALIMPIGGPFRSSLCNNPRDDMRASISKNVGDYYLRQLSLSRNDLLYSKIAQIVRTIVQLLQNISSPWPSWTGGQEEKMYPKRPISLLIISRAHLNALFTLIYTLFLCFV